MKIAARLGHRIILPMPCLVPLIVKEHYPGLLEGLTLKDIRILLSGGNKKIVSEIGGLLFTGCGISGPLVLTLSGQAADWLKAGKEVYAEVDLMPALSREEIEAQLLSVVKSNPRKTTKNMLKTFLPDRFISVFLDIARISSGKIASYITQEERKKIVSLLKGVRFTIAKAGPIEAAMITRGGISLKEVNPRTMESRLVKNLYFAGEILDVDADSGGFNLQAAFSTGYLAGQSSVGSFQKNKEKTLCLW